MQSMLTLPDFRVRQRDFLLEISRAITSQLDLGEVLKRVLHASIVMLGGQMGLIALRAQDSLFYVRAISGLDSSYIPKLNRHLHDLTKMVQDGADKDAFNQKLAEMADDINAGVKQSVALPLIFANEPLGMMIVLRTYSSAATTNDMQILQSFADQAAIAVHNAQLYESINHERTRLEAILDQSADGVMILDSNLNILRFNRALERMTGWESKDAVGLHQDEVLQWQNLENGDLQAAIDDGWPFTLAAAEDEQDSPLYVEGDLKRPDGLSVSIGITYAPMFSSDGKVTNIIANVRDITNFREAQEMQNTFISIISHELKTPVAIIKGYAATLSRPDAQWDENIIHNTLNVIEDEADRLTELIQNLLTASKLQAQRGELQIDEGDVWLDSIVRRSVERCSTQTSKHEFSVYFPPDFPMIHGDETKLRQVVDNLLNNAIKYSPNGGVIEVGGEYNEHLVKIYVSDPGVGLTKEDQGRIFERFYRVDGKLSRKTQGTGLGLYLSKAIIEAHGGVIRVESQPGHGSTFYFTLPRH